MKTHQSNLADQLHQLCDSAGIEPGTWTDRLAGLYRMLLRTEPIKAPIAEKALSKKQKRIAQYEDQINGMIAANAIHNSHHTTWADVKHAFGNAYNADIKALKKAWRNVK